MNRLAVSNEVVDLKNYSKMLQNYVPNLFCRLLVTPFDPEPSQYWLVAKARYAWQGGKSSHRDKRPIDASG